MVVLRVTKRWQRLEDAALDLALLTVCQRTASGAIGNLGVCVTNVEVRRRA